LSSRLGYRCLGPGAALRKAEAVGELGCARSAHAGPGWLAGSVPDFVFRPSQSLKPCRIT